MISSVPTDTQGGSVEFSRVNASQIWSLTTSPYVSKDLQKTTHSCIDLKRREDKGDREGIPHTHSIPWVIRLELFLELIWSYLARCVDVSWRFRMTKRRAKNVGWKADESIKKSRAFLIIEAKWVGAHLGISLTRSCRNLSAFIS